MFPTHDDSTRDRRYTVTMEHNGHPNGPHPVVRFCGTYVGWSPSAQRAWEIACAHAEARKGQGG